MLLNCFDNSSSPISRAMILGRLFDNLFRTGLIMIGPRTGRRKNCYKDGLNRTLFVSVHSFARSRLYVVSCRRAGFSFGKGHGRENQMGTSRPARKPKKAIDRALEAARSAAPRRPRQWNVTCSAG